MMILKRCRSSRNVRLHLLIYVIIVYSKKKFEEPNCNRHENVQSKKIKFLSKIEFITKLGPLNTVLSSLSSQLESNVSYKLRYLVIAIYYKNIRIIVDAKIDLNTTYGCVRWLGWYSVY